MGWYPSLYNHENKGQIRFASVQERRRCRGIQKRLEPKLAKNDTPDPADVQGVTRHQVLAALGKLKVVGVTLTEAVGLFLRFGKPLRGKATITQATRVLLTA